MRLVGVAEGADVVRNAAFRVLANATDIGRAVITLPLLSRHLGAHDFGVWGTALAVFAIAEPLAITGISGTLVRDAARWPHRAAAIVETGRLLRSRCTIVALAAGALFALMTGGVQLALLTTCVLLSLWIDACTTQSILLTVHLRDDRTAIARLAGNAVFLAGVVALVLLDGGLFGLAAVFLARAAVRGLLVAHYSRALLPVDARGEYTTSELVTQASPVIVTSVASAAHLQADIPIVAYLVGPAEAAILAAASRLAYLPMFVAGAINKSVMPVLARRTRAEAAVFTARMVPLYAGLGVIVFVGCVVFGPVAVALFGAGFEQVTDVLPILGLRVALMFAIEPIGTELMATRRQMAHMWCSLASLVVWGVALVGGVAAYGLVGAAWVGVASQIPKGLLLYAAARRP